MVDHVRTCTGCQGTDEKEKLLRVVRSERGIKVDPGQSLPGRGAYVHRAADCIERAFARGGLARTLRSSIDRKDLEELTRALAAVDCGPPSTKIGSEGQETE